MELHSAKTPRQKKRRRSNVSSSRLTTARNYLRDGLQRHWRIVASVVALTVVAQLLYPHDRAVPFAHFDGERVGFTQKTKLEAKIMPRFERATVHVTAASKQVTLPLKNLGAELDDNTTADRVAAYPLWARLLPLSVLWYQPHIDTLDVKYQTELLETKAKELSQTLTLQPTDAGLVIEGSNIVFTRARSGSQVTPKMITTMVYSMKVTTKATKVVLQPASTTPQYSDDDFKKVRQAAEEALKTPLVFHDDKNRTFTADKAKVASWLTIKKSDNHTVSLALEPTKLSDYFATLNKTVGITPQPTVVTVRDGVESGRKAGIVGRAIDETAASDAVTNALLKNSSRTITLTTKDIAPPVNYNRSYSSSQAGLNAYVKYLTETEDVHVALQQLDGQKWSAKGRADESVVSASTYKLYIAMMLFSRIDDGKANWNDSIQGRTVRTCFDQMIVQSLNNCAEYWIKQFGGGTGVNQFLYGKGLSTATTFTAPDAVHTSASDLLKTLLGLANSTLYKSNNRDILLDDMAKQVYRNGVPAGSMGTVQDKVGFLWDYNHDAALVHTPKGSYAVAILTKGKSFSDIARITKQLESIMYP